MSVAIYECLGPARTEEPQIHFVAAIPYDDDPDYGQLDGYPYKGSSWIEDSGLWQPKPVPSVFHASRDSRMVAQTIYTCLSYRKYSTTHPDLEYYYNTLYDSFYMCHQKWTKFKILVDILIRLNTTRLLERLVQKDLNRFQNIRFFIVDFNIFGAALSRLWAEFNKLEKLTIAIYPYKTMSDPEKTPYTDEPSFITPQRGSYHGKRAAWVRQAALDLLQSVKDHDVPRWKIPEVEVVVRRTGNEDTDDQVMEEWTDEDILEMEGNDIEELADDSVWYEQAAEVLAQTVSQAEIKRLKRKFHPSRKVSIYDRECWIKERLLGSYFTDASSETESTTV